MDALAAPMRARWTLGIIFTTFLIANVVVLCMALLSAIRGDGSLLPPHMGVDSALGVRLAVVLVASVAAWFFAQTLYKQLIREQVAPADSVSPSMGLLSYLVLIAAAYSFLGFGSWLWLPFLFLIIFTWTMLSLWSFVGWVAMICAITLAAVAGVLTFLLN